MTAFIVGGIIGLVLGFVGGLLVGRKNPDVADKVAAEVEKVKREAPTVRCSAQERLYT